MARQEKKMRVEVISTESIKPSSPTPQHLKNFKLSLLDQLIPVPFAPIVLFYPNHNSVSHLEVLERSNALKQSLSETLTRFYPLAGTLKDDLYVDCNDKGAYFSVAQVDCHLNDFLNHPDIHSIHQFLPCEPTFSSSTAGTRVTNIQINIFECGGMAIGLCISHKILDGAAISTFLKGWTGIANGSDSSEAVYPDFSAPKLFPANDLWLRDSSMVMWGSLIKKGKCATKRFVFDASDIANLKAEATKKGVQHPSRVEVVSAFIWKSAMDASEENHGTKRPSLLTHVVNLRKRAQTTFSENSIGNLIWIASAKNKTKKRSPPLHSLVDQVRISISKINGDFVKKLQGDSGPTTMSKSLKGITEYGSGADYFACTSWCKFGFYHVDFGWGKPVWVTSSVGPSSPVFMNFIILMDTRCGEGIEAWVTLDEREMVILESDIKLQEFTSIDPSPLRNENTAVDF